MIDNNNNNEKKLCMYIKCNYFPIQSKQHCHVLQLSLATAHKIKKQKLTDICYYVIK